MITEDHLEQLALTWFQDWGWSLAHPGSSPGQALPDIAHDGPAPERASHNEVVLRGRLREALHLFLTGALLFLCGSALAQPCTVSITGPSPATLCAGTELNLVADTAGSNFGPGATITWSVTPGGTGYFTPSTGASTTYSVAPPVAATVPNVTITVTVSGSATCPGLTTDNMVFDLLATPLAGLSASIGGSPMSTTTVYGPDLFTFTLCGSPVPASTWVTFTDASTGPAVTGSSIVISGAASGTMPASGIFVAGLDTVAYTVTSASGCSNTVQVGVLIGPTVSSMSSSVGIPSGYDVCVGGPVVFDVAATSQNPPGMIYVMQIDDGPNLIPVDTMFSLPPSPTPGTFTYTFTTNSCGASFSAPNSFGMNALPLYGCYSGFPATGGTSQSIFVSDPPVADIGGPTSACVGNVSFNDQSTGTVISTSGLCGSPYGYWTLSGVPGTDWVVNAPYTLGDDGGSPGVPSGWNEGSDPLVVDFQLPGTYTLQLFAGTSAECPTDVDQLVICIEDAPAVPSFSLSATSGCAPFTPDITNLGPLTFGCTGNYHWNVVWSGPSCVATGDTTYLGGTTANSYDPQIQFNNPGTYSITLVADNSCPGTVSSPPQNLSVDGPPTATIDPVPAAVCAGVPVDLTSNIDSCGSAASMAWTSSYFGITATADTVLSYPNWTPPPASIADTITLVASNACGSSPIDTAFVTVLPAASAVVVLYTGPVCIGGSFGLWVPGGDPALTYTWTQPNGSTYASGLGLDSIGIPAATLVHAGIWSLNASLGGACGAVGDTTVVVYPPPPLALVVLPSDTICPGGSTTITANVGGAAGTFLWSPGACTDADTTVSPAVSSTYTVTFTDQVTGCTNTADTTIVVQTVIVSAGADLSGICDAGLPVSLTGGLPGGGTWSIVSGPGSVTNGLSPSFTPAPGGPYTTVLQYDYNVLGCPGSDQMNVNVIAFTPANAGPTSHTCFCDPAFNLPSGTPAPGTWTPLPGMLTAAGLFDPCAGSSAGGSYTVWYHYGTGTSCEDSASTMVIVHPLPVVGPFANDTVCANSGLIALPMVPPGGSWSGPFVAPGSNVFDSDLASTGIPYVLTYDYTDTSDPNISCSNSATLNMFVQPAPIAGFTALPDPACEGTPVVFTDLSVPGPGGGPVGLAWDFGDPGSGANNTSSLPNPSHIYAVGGAFYTATLIASQGFCSDTIAQALAIQAQPQAGFTLSDDTICDGTAIDFLNTSTGSIDTYTWVLDPGGSVLANPGSTVYYAALPCDTLTHQISLTVLNSVCPASSASASLFVIPDPIASFTLLEDTVCSSDTVTVFNTSNCDWMDTTAVWDWDYPDGALESAANAPITLTHSYLNTDYSVDVHNISLTVSNVCSSSTFILPVTVMPDSITAVFSAAPDSGCASLNVDFTQTMVGVLGWIWDFDYSGGPGSTALDPSYSYPLGGTYTVMFAVTNGCAHDTSFQQIIVHAPADLAITADPDTVCEGGAVTFENIGGAVTSLLWSFDDPGSGANTSTALSPTHTFTQSGTYTVVATAQDPVTFCPGSDTVIVTVLDAPQAAFTTNPPAGCAPLNVDLLSTSIDALSVHWIVFDVGGPVNYFSTSANHLFSTAGSFPVMLIAENASGCLDTATTVIEAYPPVTSAFTFAPDSSCISPVNVSFTNGSSGVGPLNYAWSFGVPPASSGLTDPSYLYAAPGNYVACLQVTSQDGCTDQYCDTVHVFPTPLADFDVLETACQGDEVIFNDLSVNAITYAWVFGTGDGSSDPSPTYTYADTGWYEVTLVVTGIGGCTNTTTQTNAIHVTTSPIASFTWTMFGSDPAGVHLHDQSVGADSISWVLGGSGSTSEPDPVIVFPPYDGSEYEVCLTAYNGIGCVDDTCYRFLIHTNENGTLFVPNAFSPNHDHVNEVFVPVLLGWDGWSYEFRIFDRWGMVVFESDVRGEGWNGEGFPIDVYVWTVRLCSNGADCGEIELEDRALPNEEAGLERHIGHVTLVR